MRQYLFILLVFMFMLSACNNSSAGTAVAPAASKPAVVETNSISLIKTYTMNDTFDSALFNLKEALKDKGMVINKVSHIGKMLKRTAKDLGKGKKIFAKAKNIEFCSATVSRKMMEANPHNIIYCPYIISIYSLADNPQKTFVSYRRLPRLKDKKSDQALQQVEKLLNELARISVQ